MSNSFYSPDEQRAAKVRELFTLIARRYDRLNNVLSLGLHRRWKRRVAALAGTPTRTLDLCCGTGDIAMRLAHRGGLPGTVVGVDFTVEMLRVAATRQPGGKWVQADALRLPFADESFDVVTVGYGLRNLADLSAGLREIRRVLRPGGRLVSLDFGKPAAALWRRLYFAHLRFWVPVLGRVLAGNRAAYAYILPSLEDYPGQRGVQAAMVGAGFVECGLEEFVGGAMAVNFGSKPR